MIDNWIFQLIHFAFFLLKFFEVLHLFEEDCGIKIYTHFEKDWEKEITNNAHKLDRRHLEDMIEERLRSKQLFLNLKGVR